MEPPFGDHPGENFNCGADADKLKEEYEQALYKKPPVAEEKSDHDIVVNWILSMQKLTARNTELELLLKDMNASNANMLATLTRAQEFGTQAVLERQRYVRACTAAIESLEKHLYRDDDPERLNQWVVFALQGIRNIITEDE
jgi:hypothetical protein